MHTGAQQVSHKQYAMSMPRRNLGAVAYGQTIYLAGGCLIEGKSVEFVCDNATDVIDMLVPPPPVHKGESDPDSS